MHSRLCVAALLIAALSLPVFGQSKESSASPVMRKPGPGPLRARLSFLVGEFTTSTRVITGRPGAKEGLGTGTTSIRWGLDSMFLFIDEQSVNSMLGNYRGFGVLGIDPAGKEYTLTMYNNFGDQPAYHGAFSGDTLVFTTRVPFAGGSFDQKVVWFAEGKSVRLQVFNDLGKGFVEAIDQTYRPRMAVPAGER